MICCFCREIILIPVYIFSIIQLISNISKSEVSVPVVACTILMSTCCICVSQDIAILIFDHKLELTRFNRSCACRCNNDLFLTGEPDPCIGIVIINEDTRLFLRIRSLCNQQFFAPDRRIAARHLLQCDSDCHLIRINRIRNVRVGSCCFCNDVRKVSGQFIMSINQQTILVNIRLDPQVVLII